MLKIKQAPTTVKKLGHNLRKFEHTTSAFEIPYVKGKWEHGLRGKEEIEKVESYYGGKFDNPADNQMWGNLSFQLNHMISPIESLENPEDLLKVRVLQNMKVIADSLEDAMQVTNTSDFVLYDEDQEVEITATLYERRDEAIVKLFELKKSKRYCMAVAKHILPSNNNLSTLNHAYTKLREYVDGKLSKNQKEALTNFFRVLDMDKELLFTHVDFADAFRKNIIRKNTKGRFYNPMTGTEYGKNVDEVISFLINPKNQDEIGTGAKTDESYSIRAQLKTA